VSGDAEWLTWRRLDTPGR